MANFLNILFCLSSQKATHETEITEENSEISDFEAKASNDYFVWSSAPSDSGTDDDHDWNTGAAQDDAESSESDHCDDPEEDLIEETTERDIRFANIWQFWTIFNSFCGSLTDWQKPEK